MLKIPSQNRQNIKQNDAKRGFNLMNPDALIQYLLDQGLVITRFDKFLNEQMIEISPFGIEIHTILNKLKTTSEESEKTNILAAEKVNEEERNL